jgi:hypothetical protein
MALELHTISVNKTGQPPAMLDRLHAGLYRDVPFPASAASVTGLGAITAGTGFATLPNLAPSGGTLTAGVTPADPAAAIATSLKCVTATPATPGTGVAINDTFTLSGGTVAPAGPYGTGTTTAGVAAVATITHLQAVSAVVNAGGSGGTNGAVTITGTTGTGTKFQATGTIAGGALTGPLTVTVPGDYTVGPTSLAAEPVTGGSLTGATVTVVMGALTASVTTAGGYTAAPPTANTPANLVGTGAGVTLTCVYGLGGALVTHGGNYSVAPSFTVSGGGGSGASIATATLGGSGNAIPRFVTAELPAAYMVRGGLNCQDGKVNTVYKSNRGFTLGLVPPSTTLAAGTFDALVVG